MTCTFSWKKQKGYQKRQKASVENGQQDLTRGFLIQSSPSNPKDTTEEQICSDQRLLVSPLTANGAVYDDDGGGQLLSKPLSNELADSPPDFLAEFDQQAKQDGENIFNLGFSPSPFFSPALPNTPAEPTQIGSVTTPDNSLMLPLSSGDDIPPFFTPHRKSQDSSLLDFDTHTDATLLSSCTGDLQAPTYQNRAGQSCQCLAAVVFAVEELESGCNSGNRADLDSIVAYEKEAVNCCRSMLKCGGCGSKRENLVLLVFMAKKIVALCGRIVILYREKNSETRASSVTSLMQGCSPFERPSHSGSVEDWEFSTSLSSTLSNTDSSHSSSVASVSPVTPLDWQETLLGDYEISSPLEWEHVVRVLIFLQLREVMELLADMKKTGNKILGERQMVSLVQAETQAAQLKKDVYSL